MAGNVEVQLSAANAWMPASRNLALPELAWVRTGAASRVEIELDDGGAARLTADSLLELSDYTRLSSGQRITVISLDRGVAYFTGEAKGRDALILAVPGAQLTIGRGVRVRLEAGQAASQISMIEGSAMFSSPAAELALKEGQTVKVEPGRASRFALYAEVAPVESDRWNQERDQALASSSSAAHVANLHYGLDDLDAHGAWISTNEHGTVWKPNQEAGWTPFRQGRWLWYPQIGYTWVSAELWGWLPYHYGRWTRSESQGWLWVPGTSLVFKPGDTYWLRAPGLAGWGPLAPGEVWTAGAVPQLYLHGHTTYAKFTSDMREVDPATLSRPRDTLANAVFAAALPGPALVASRLDAQRPVLRAGSTRIVPALPGITFEQAAPVQQAASPPELPVSMSPPPIQQPTTPREPEYRQIPVETTVIVPVPVETPVYYPAPVYTGIVVVNPPEKKRAAERPHRREPERQPERRIEPPAAAPRPAPAQPIQRATNPEPPREQRRETPRDERRQERRTEQPPAAPAPPEQTIPRESNEGGRERRQR
jgi:hypothetical protein